MQTTATTPLPAMALPAWQGQAVPSPDIAQVAESPAARPEQARRDPFRHPLARFLLRRRFWVNQHLQLRMIGANVWLYLIVCGVLVASLFGPLLFASALAPDSSATTLLADSHIFLYLHERLWTTLGLCTVLLVLFTVRLSHRVAGPMVRFRRHMKLMAEGVVPGELRTRKNDLMVDEVEALNAMSKSLGETISSLQHHCRELRVAMRRCESVLEDTSDPQVSKRLGVMSRRLASLESELEGLEVQ